MSSVICYLHWEYAYTTNFNDPVFGIQFTNVPSDPMAPKKKQHYTPNFILSGFADDATRTLWVWDKSQRTCRPVRGTPRYDAFTQNHYYTLKDTSGNHDLSVENYLAGLEDEAARIITDLIRFALAPLYPPPNFKKKECLARFLWAQHMRSPAARAEIVNSEEAKQMYHDASLRAARPLGADRGIVVLKNGDPAAALARASKRALMMTEDSDAVHYMRHMNLDLVSIVHLQDAEFVTSDRPCLICPVLNPGGKAFMAVTKHVAVQLSRPHESRGDIHKPSPEIVKRINKKTFDTATRFVAGGSRERLEALASE